MRTQVFGETRPAATAVVTNLLDPRWLVEIEAGGAPGVTDGSGNDGKQIYPSSITGTGSVFAIGGSVLDHAFGKGDPYTLGVEEEYMLLDGDTFDLVQHIDTVLAAMAGHELEDRVNPELMQSVLEIATPVCRTPADVDAELRKLRGYVRDVASEKGLRVGSAGTHLFRSSNASRITARDRYRALVDQMQYVARRELIFGLHIHVAVDDPEKAIQVVNGLLVELGSLLALSANSPFWRSEPTKASRRHGRWCSRPSRGRARRRASATTPTTPRCRRPAGEDRLHRELRISGGTVAYIPLGPSRSGSATR